MAKGNFIVIEGVDGAGTTTHTGRLTKTLQNRSISVHATREPSDGPIGLMLRQILTGRLVVPSQDGPRSPRWETMALLFAADRVDHIESEIDPFLRQGGTVISDRYDHSSVAYQSTNAGGSRDAIEWVRAINRHARRPDLVLVLDVPPQVARERRGSRTTSKEMYDSDELQTKLASFYREIDSHFPEDRIIHIDASGSLEQTTAAVLEAATDLVRV